MQPPTDTSRRAKEREWRMGMDAVVVDGAPIAWVEARAAGSHDKLHMAADVSLNGPARPLRRMKRRVCVCDALLRTS
jgi:hypothetical protein